MGKTIKERSFQFSTECDLEPLDEPLKIFPPSLYIIGAQKAGTSALTKLMKENTVMDIGFRKEIKFLAYRPDYFRLWHNQQVSFLEYKSLFSNSTGPTIDGSPGYHAFGGYIYQNLMYTLNVGLSKIPKMVLILRDPLTRLYSHYKMRRRWSTLKTHRLYSTPLPTLRRLIADDLMKLDKCGLQIKLKDRNFNPRVFYEESYMWCYHELAIKRTDMYLIKGLYAWQLEMMRRMGNPNRVIVTCYEDFNADNYGFTQMISDFVGVSIHSNNLFRPVAEKKMECPRKYREMNKLGVNLEFERTLHQFFQKWNMVLIEDFGIDCGWRRTLIC